MREYSRVAGRFWTGPTGRAIKAKGRDAQVLAMYLFTGPSMNMIGLYYLPLPTLCHEAGFTPDDARAALAALAEIGFAFYDPDEELIWIPTAALYQVGETLTVRDKRGVGVKTLLRPFRRHKFGRQFVERYKAAYSLQVNDEPKDHTRTIEAPSKPGEGTGTGAGAGNNVNPPIPPAGAGGDPPSSDPDQFELAPGLTPPTNGNGHGPMPPAQLDAALRSLTAYWRELGRYDPREPGQWASEPATVPSRDSIRNWKRDLRTGRLSIEDIRKGIAHRVRQDLSGAGVPVWNLPSWPPEEHPPPNDD